jgi:hypothetical protein
MDRTKTNNYVDRINALLKRDDLHKSHRLTLEIGLDRLAEGLSLTPTCLRSIAYNEYGSVIADLVANGATITVSTN